MIYLYDGSFDGFLSVVHANHYIERANFIYEKKKFNQFTFEKTRDVVTDIEKAKSIKKLFVDKVGFEIYSQFYYAFFSCDIEKDITLLRYMELAFKIGFEIGNIYSVDVVSKVRKLSKKVSRERHKFLGFVRFEEMVCGKNRILYSSIEPDNNILYLMGNHFSDRFYGEKIIMHDKKRKIALLCENGENTIIEFDMNLGSFKSKVEEDFQTLWRGYFKSMAIEDKISLKRQQQHVPLKYRKNLTEFK